MPDQILICHCGVRLAVLHEPHGTSLLHHEDGSHTLKRPLVCEPLIAADEIAELREELREMHRTAGVSYTVRMEYLRERNRALDLLHRLVDHEDDPCELDHHGYCQTHGLHSPPCAVAEARKLLKETAND